jgi:DNA-binding NarL/FixJ family response regulator
MGGVMTGDDTTRLLLVGEHRLLIEALKLALESQGRSSVNVADSHDPAGVLTAVEEQRPHVVVLDLDSDDAGWDLSFVARLVEYETPVVALVGTGDVYFAGQALEAGASCVFHKAGSVERLVELIDDTMDGRNVVSPAAREEFLSALAARRTCDRERFAPLALLTRREGEVLGLLAAGNTAEEIAAGRVVALTTVRTQIRAILHKLGVRSQLAAVAIARDAGWPVGERLSPRATVFTPGLVHAERNSPEFSSMLTMRS